jgi:kumamolisin
MPRRTKPAATKTSHTKIRKPPQSHPPARGSNQRTRVDDRELVEAIIIVRRRPDGRPLKDLRYFQTVAPSQRQRLTREEFEEQHGASPRDLDRVVGFLSEQRLQADEINRSSRSIAVRGTAAQFSAAFGVTFYRYKLKQGTYRGYQGFPRLPRPLNAIVEAIVGLDNRPLPMRHHTGPNDPFTTLPLTPLRVANLYNFPPGNGQGETIAIYQSPTSATTPGYTVGDVAATLAGFGGGLVAPTTVDISVAGQKNSGVSDGETLIDISVASAIAQSALIAVYFTANSAYGVVKCLQQMIHPNRAAGDPVPTVISISFGWAPDDDSQHITDDEYKQLSSLFHDAANLNITVLVSSGDWGVTYSGTTAQTSYPASDPWVLACGGTTIGVSSTGMEQEWVWNDGAGTTGGGISARFDVPAYQSAISLPTSLLNGRKGRGIPDVAGNASNNSGYPVSTVAFPNASTSGGTSVVAPLYAGLMAIINSLLREAGLAYRVGFANPLLYGLSSTVCRDVTATAGPADNSFNGVPGYPAGSGWDACTGLGTIDGAALLNAFSPLGVTIRRRIYDGCDPGPVSGETATFVAQVSGGFLPVTYAWSATGATIVGPPSAKPWIVNTHTSQILVSIPAPGTEFHLSVAITDPVRTTVTATQGFKALDPGMAGMMEALCKFIHTAEEFGPPVYVNPGDPYLRFELQRIQNLAQRVADLSGRLLRAASK